MFHETVIANDNFLKTQIAAYGMQHNFLNLCAEVDFTGRGLNIVMIINIGVYFDIFKRPSVTVGSFRQNCPIEFKLCMTIPLTVRYNLGSVATL